MNARPGILVLVRHGESLWNAKDLWTGRTDIGLSPKGRLEAQEAVSRVRDIHFDAAYTSVLSRAWETLAIMLSRLGQQDIPVERSAALNERDYGVYTGKNKFAIKREVGEAQFLKMRRSWDTPLEGGESLKDVYARVIPYYTKVVAPKLSSGKNILIVAHGNSLRALMKFLDAISDEDIVHVELTTGEIVIYKIDETGKVVSRARRLASLV